MIRLCDSTWRCLYDECNFCKREIENQAVKRNKSMQEVLTAYGLERTIYRLSISKYAEKFTLKGGIFLYALFKGEFARATRDIDLLANSISNEATDMKMVFEDIFNIECDDALYFDISTLKVVNITEFKEYHGVNVSINAYLDKTIVPVSIDVVFGDVIYPDRVKMEFPVLLDMEVPEIYAYSIYSVIAEKFEAIVSLGDANSRYKDYYDIYILANKYDYNGTELKNAISETFEHRETGFTGIVAFEEEFAEKEIHKNRWKAFLKKKGALRGVDFAITVEFLKEFLEPVVKAIIKETDFDLSWDCTKLIWK